jgi:hypothetical protein
MPESVSGRSTLNKGVEGGRPTVPESEQVVAPLLVRRQSGPSSGSHRPGSGRKWGRGWWGRYPHRVQHLDDPGPGDVGVGPAAELFTAAPEIHAKPSLSQKSFQVQHQTRLPPRNGAATRLVRVWSAKMSVTKVRHPGMGRRAAASQQVKTPSVRPQILGGQSIICSRPNSHGAGRRSAHTRRCARTGPELQSPTASAIR